MIRERRKRKRIITRIAKAFLTCAAVCGVIALILTFGFKIKQIDYEGNTVYTDEQIYEVVAVNGYCSNSVYLWFHQKFMADTDITFVDRICVKILSPTHVKIVTEEKEMIGYVEGADGYLYFDRSGVITEYSQTLLSGRTKVTGATVSGASTESADVSADALSEVSSDATGDTAESVLQEEVSAESADASGDLTISGDESGDVMKECIPEGDAYIGQSITFDSGSALNYLLLSMQQLEDNGLTADEIAVSEHASLMMIFGQVTVKLGKNENTADKILRISQILENLTGKSGYIDMSDWTEKSDDIIFRES